MGYSGYLVSRARFWAIVICFLSCSCILSAFGDGTLLIPRMNRPFVVDGNLAEWSVGARVPMLSASHIVTMRHGHVWKGIRDAGMETFAAWNPCGLCLAAVVSDDYVVNDAQPSKYWQQDCVEFMIDARTGQQFHSSYYGRGAYQILIRPPMKGKPAKAALNPRDGKIEGLQVAGKRTATGYVVELFVPWKAFPGFTPKDGANIGLHFALDDCDKGDQKDQPMQMMWNSMKWAWNNPSEMGRWKLIEPSKKIGADAVFTNTDLDLPPQMNEHGTAVFHVIATKPLIRSVDSARVRVFSENGKLISTKNVRLKHLAAPFSDVLSGDLRYPTSSLPAGNLKFEARLSGKGKTIGTITRTTENLGPIVDFAKRHIQKANISKLSQVSPFKAVLYLDIAASTEKVKRGVTFRDKYIARGGAFEARARLDVIEKGHTDQKGIYDLLNLTANPESQVVVQYSYENSANVNFVWGAVPLATVTVADIKDNMSPDQMAGAAAAYRRWNWPLKDLSEKLQVGASSKQIFKQDYDLKPISEEDFSPDKQVALIISYSNTVLVMSPDQMKNIDYAEASILPECPEATAKAVREWAEEQHRGLLDPNAVKATMERMSPVLLIAGDFRNEKLPNQQRFKWYLIDGIKDRYQGMELVSGKRIISIRTPSEKVAERAVRLVSEKKPVPVEEVDAMRKDLVAEFAPADISPGHFFNTFFGDVGSYTFYSDGAVSAVERLLRSITDYQDFNVITDYNDLSGAEAALRLMKRYGPTYPLIVGEKIVEGPTSVSAYPLTKPIKPNIGITNQIRAAHQQGAVVQVNHDFNRYMRFFNDSGSQELKGLKVDAWNHVPPDYVELQRTGRLPLLVGSSEAYDELSGFQVTAIAVSALSGKGVAYSIMAGVAAIVSDQDQYYVYGNVENTRMVWAALKEGKGLKSDKEDRLRKALSRIDLIGLLEAAPGRITRDRE